MVQSAATKSHVEKSLATNHLNKVHTAKQVKEAKGQPSINFFGSDSTSVVCSNAAGLMTREFLQTMTEYLYSIARAYEELTTNQFDLQTRSSQMMGDAAKSSIMNDAAKALTNGIFSIVGGSITAASAIGSQFVGRGTAKSLKDEQGKLNNLNSWNKEMMNPTEMGTVKNNAQVEGAENNGGISSVKAEQLAKKVELGHEDVPKFDARIDEHTVARETLVGKGNQTAETRENLKQRIRDKENLVTGYRNTQNSISSYTQMFSNFASQSTQGLGQIWSSMYDKRKAEQEYIRAVLNPVLSQSGQMSSTASQKMSAVLDMGLEFTRNLRQVNDSTFIRG